ncbi:MAG: DUF2165 family protein [Pararhodobacter sp.]|nr:DUF2165 family protein [Pararhodobacter sp.]
METAIILCQAGCLALLAAWLSVALHDNFRHAEINAQFTREVLSMSRIGRDYPGVLDKVGKRRILHAGIQRAVFITIVIAETLVTALLWVATGAMLTVALGAMDLELARVLGLVGAFGFTAIWAGFVIAGNHFCYWLCHEGAQNTHFQLLLWGMGTLLLMALA